MPVFKLQEDLKLPMVTQLVQIEKEDVQAFLARDEYTGLERKICSPMALKADLKTQAAVLSVRDLTREILTQRAAIGNTDMELIARLGAAYQQHSPIFTVEATKDDDGFATNLKRIPVENNLEDGLLIVLDDLITIIEKNLRVLTCEECKNPFVPRKAGVVHYCSNRCGNRARGKRFSQSKRSIAA